jgi:hypothetical protein
MKITETSERRVASPEMSLSAVNAPGYQVMYQVPAMHTMEKRLIALRLQCQREHMHLPILMRSA